MSAAAGIGALSISTIEGTYRGNSTFPTFYFRLESYYLFRRKWLGYVKLFNIGAIAQIL